MTGYFGKVSTHGDFVRRGLPDDLATAWDAWLQQCMLASRAALGERWLGHYLTSPVWRFAIAPGVLGPDGLGGVMMPSVDRVGRYFPLMLGATGAPPLLDWFHAQAPWFDALEDLARSSLDAAFRLARFDALPAPAPAPAPALAPARDGTPVHETGMWRLPLDGDVKARVAGVALRGHSLWWTDGSPSVEASLLVCAGMPQAHAFAALLDGRW